MSFLSISDGYCATSGFLRRQKLALFLFKKFSYGFDAESSFYVYFTELGKCANVQGDIAGVGSAGSSGGVWLSTS